MVVVPLTSGHHGGMVSDTMSPGWTTMSSVMGLRLPPMGSARNRSGLAPRIKATGMVKDLVELPVARPSLTRWPPLMA